jgi:hypothetical protein
MMMRRIRRRCLSKRSVGKKRGGDKPARKNATRQRGGNECNGGDEAGLRGGKGLVSGSKGALLGIWEARKE